MELTSSGKSGSFFYYTADGQYILKTISYSEYKTLYRILPSYFRHIVESKSTLINRYYGLHKLVLMPNENQASQDQVAQKVYFVIMNNIFDSARDIHSIYDLKGSTYKRRVETTSDPSIPRKDQNFLEDGVQLHLKSAEYNHFCDMILTDSNFLRQNDLIDYSLLLGIHDQDKQLDQSSSNLKKSLVSEIDSSRHFFISLLTVLASNFHNVINKASWSAFSADGKYIYTAGIIDILTSFGQEFISFSRNFSYQVGQKKAVNSLSSVHAAAKGFPASLQSNMQKDSVILSLIRSQLKLQISMGKNQQKLQNQRKLSNLSPSTEIKKKYQKCTNQYRDRNRQNRAIDQMRLKHNYNTKRKERMSVSLFGFEKSKQNQYLEKLHAELQTEVPGNTFQDNLQRSKLRLLGMMRFCKENYDQEAKKSGATEEEQGRKKGEMPKHLQNFDKLRQQMKHKIINVPQQDEKMKIIIENDDEKEEVEEEVDHGSIGFSQNKNDSFKGLGKPSSLNARSNKQKNRDSIAVNNSNKRKFKNNAIESIRHRNSEFIRDSDVRGKAGPGLSKFGPSKQSQLSKMHSFGYESELKPDQDLRMKQRDSIDVSYINQSSKTGQRPSTIAEIRNSMFQFKNELVFNKNKDELLVEDEDINDIYSDLSGNEFDAEQDQTEGDNFVMESSCLQLQYLQHQNRFISSQGTAPFNIQAIHQDKAKFAEDLEHLPESKLSKRTVYFQELTPEMTVNNFSFGGKILEKNLRSGESDLNEVVVCYETKEEFEKDISKGEKNAGSVTHHSIRVKDIDGVDPSDMDRIRRGVELIGSGFSSSQEELPKFGLSLAGHQISSHVLNPKFFRKHLTSQKLLSLAESTENPNCVFATAHSGNISVNLELGRLSNPLKIDKSFKVMFNEVDGLEVEDILEPGFSDDQLKNFIPKRESYFIECINRDPNDKSLFKKFLLDIMKSKGECVSMDILDQSFDGMINNKEAVSKIIRLKNEFFLKEIIKASKPALLKVNFIRKYESLDMVKKMATCIFFYSAPHVESDASKNEIGQILRSQYLRNCNVHIFGAGLQQQLPPLRNDFFTSQPIFNINLDYDGLVGYDQTREQFFFYADSTLSTKKGKNMECEFLNGGADESSASLDLIDSFKPISNVASLNHPSEGPWFVLPKEKQVSLSSGTLIKSDHDILRVWNKKIKFCLKANQ